MHLENAPEPLSSSGGLVECNVVMQSSPKTGEKRFRTGKVKQSKDHCMFYMEKKFRYCSVAPCPGSVYCGVHKPTSEQKDKRVACPYGNHTVKAVKLKKHLKTCPDYILHVQLTTQPTYEKGINMDTVTAPVPLPLQVPTEGMDSKPSKAKQRLALAEKLGQRAFESLVRRVERAHAAMFDDAESHVWHEDGNNTSRRSTSVKHSSQQEAIISNMDEYGLLKDAGSKCFIEFGAGKGHLTGKLVETCADIQDIVLVDRGAFKLLADRKLRTKSLHRIRCDIAHFNPRKLPHLESDEARWVALGKHLCGSATDLTLRCCSKNINPKGGGVQGYAIATCCHHLCEWSQYVAKNIVTDLGFTPEEFELICYMSSWCTCGHDVGRNCSADTDSKKEQNRNRDIETRETGSKEEQETGSSEEQEIGSKEEQEIGNSHYNTGDREQRTTVDQHSADRWRPQSTLDRACRQRIGKICKELIDRGRVLWWKGLGDQYQAQDLNYIEAQTSIENRLLLGKKL